MTGWQESLTRTLELGGLMLVHGTALALVTWLLCGTVLRRAQPAVHAVLWTVVLIKFLVPPVLPGELGLSGWLVRFAPVAAFVGGSDGRVKPEVENLSRAGGRASTPAVAESLPPPVPGEKWPLILALLYTAGLAILVGRSAAGSFRLWRYVRTLPGPTLELRAEVEALGRELGLKRAPEIRVSDQNASPYVMGFLRSTLVLPGGLFAELCPVSRRALVVHELAHVRRGDLLVRMLQNLTRTVLFFWPPVWWVCRRIERFAEMACDQWALAVASVSPSVYARSLLQVVRSIAVPGHRHQELAFARKGRVLEERFEMILKQKKGISPRLTGLTILVLAVWMSFALGGGWGSGASGQPQEPTPERSVEKIQLRGEAGSVLPVDLLERFPEADADGNGELTMAEFHSYRSAHPDESRVAMIVCRMEEGADEPVCDFTSEDKPGHLLHSDHFAGLAEKILEKHPEVDLDRDGTLSREELEHHLQENSEATRVVASEIRAESGADNLVFVSEDETVDQEPQHRRQIRVVTSSRGSEALIQQFPEADLDGDGQLNREEVAALGEFLVQTVELHVDSSEEADAPVQKFSWTTDDGKQMTIKIQGVVPEMDLNGDGEVSADEARSFAESREHHTGAGDHRLYFRKEMDAEPSAEEITARRERMADARRAHLLQKYPEADADGDGVLNKGEAEALSKRLQELKKQNR